MCASAEAAQVNSWARREALGTLEEARAREFTWAASAEAHMASYQRAAAQRAE